MKRRHFLNSAAVGATSIGALAKHRATTAQPLTSSQPVIQWRMATSWPKTLDIIFGSVEAMCQQISKMTAGRFTITPYEAGAIVPALKVLDAVQAGQVECGHTISYYYLDKNPALAFGAALPFGLTAYQQYAWFHYGGGLETLQKLHSDFGVVFFPAGSPGVQMGGWFRKEINTVADFQGLKFRIPGFGGQVMSRLGADVKLLGGDKIYEALAKGELDGAEWQNPYDDENLGLHRVAQFYYYPGWWEPGTTYEVLVKRSQWEQLPKEYRQIFQSAAAQMGLTMVARVDAANGEALERLIKGGTQLRAYSPNILQSAQKTTFELLEEQAGQDATFKQVYDQWKTFRDQIYQWNAVNELSFDRFTLQDSV
jgi:TRAP-type mannitol/chloroaromatic compound transport system substrate-binding protein